MLYASDYPKITATEIRRGDVIWEEIDGWQTVSNVCIGMMTVSLSFEGNRDHLGLSLDSKVPVRKRGQMPSPDLGADFDPMADVPGTGPGADFLTRRMG